MFEGMPQKTALGDSLLDSPNPNPHCLVFPWETQAELMLTQQSLKPLLDVQIQLL